MGKLIKDLVKIGVGAGAVNKIAKNHAMQQGKEARKSIKEQAKQDERGKFCEGCGKAITKTNLAGKCVRCNKILCKSCANKSDKGILCDKCLRERGTIPIWLVIIGFFIYVIPGIALLVVRHLQINNKINKWNIFN